MTTESSRNVRNSGKTTSTIYTKYVQGVRGFFSCDNGPELLNVSIRRIRLNSRILLNKKNRRKFNL